MNSQIVALMLILMGALFLLGHRFLPFIGHLPGDLRFEWGNVRVFLPLGTGVLVSLLLTLLLRILGNK